MAGIPLSPGVCAKRGRIPSLHSKYSFEPVRDREYVWLMADTGKSPDGGHRPSGPESYPGALVLRFVWKLVSDLPTCLAFLDWRVRGQNRDWGDSSHASGMLMLAGGLDIDGMVGIDLIAFDSE
jgi:hypothetical protein